MAPGDIGLHWGGVASCALGGLLYLISRAQGKQARQLETAWEVDRLTDLKAIAGCVPLLVAVTGRAWSASPLKCEFTNQPAVIARFVEEQQSMKQADTGGWVPDRQQTRHSVREAPWALEVLDSRGSPDQLPVIEGRSAEQRALQLAGENFVADERQLVTKVLDSLVGWRPLGRRQTEHVLPVGALVTAVGELASVVDGQSLRTAFPHSVQAGPGQVLVLRGPAGGRPFILSNKSLAQMVADLNGCSRLVRYVAYGFGALGACLIAFKVAKDAVTAFRQRRLRQAIKEANEQRAAALGGRRFRSSGTAPAEPGSAGEDSDELNDRAADLCVVCLEDPCGAVFQDCGHMCTCWRCGSKLSRCPICRSRTSPIRVYRT